MVTLFDAISSRFLLLLYEEPYVSLLFDSSIRMYDAWFLPVAELITVVSLAASIAQLIGTTVKAYKGVDYNIS